jgi:hypothetical protein
MSRRFKPPFSVDQAIWEDPHLRAAYMALNAEGAGQGGALTSSDQAIARRELAAGMGLRSCSVNHSRDDFEGFMQDWDGEHQD